MKRPKIKKLLAYFILFSIACGPGPLDFTEYFTIFYPEAANNPSATQPYFYTNDFLNQQYSMLNSAQLADSLNIESWYNYTDKKIDKAAIKKGLYEKTLGEEFASQLRKIGKTEAADYVLLAQEADKETEKFSTYWEPAEPVNEQLLADLRDVALINADKSKSDFIKERYGFQLMKMDAKANDWRSLFSDYEKFQEEVKTKTYISEWSQSRYAGALLYQGDTAKSVLEFAKVFEKSPTRRNQADLSVRRLTRQHFKEALGLCQSEEEKLMVYALQAIQPFQDGLELLTQMTAINPNHPMLELVMAREINKNEVNFYAEKNGGLYSHNLDVLDENYKIDTNKVQTITNQSKTYFQSLLAFNESLLRNETLNEKAFWLTTAAYLHYIGGNYLAMKPLLSRAEDESPDSPSLQNQIKLFKTLYFLETEAIDAEEESLLEQIAQFKKTDNFRDNNVLVLLTDKLRDKYLNIEKAPAKSWLQSCFQGKEQNIDTRKIKAFLAENIPAVKENDYSYMNGTSEARLLEIQEPQLLEATIDFINSEDLSSADEQLITLSGINKSNLLMAYGRKLIRTQQYEKALAVFKQCEASHFFEGAFMHYFSPIPRQFIIGEEIDEGLLSPIYFLENAVKNQKEVIDNPKNARAWYELGLAAYNMSYWGKGWLFSDREWSSMEIQYGEPTSEDYFTNTYAKECFEKALAANPEAELGAKICYMGALCERNQYFVAYTNGKPNTYKQEELDYYRIKMETSVKPTFQSFFKRLKNKYDETAYESQVIKECMSYVSFKLQ
ncbi:hypothetical protein [Arcticibacterium luteifluviistationis]|uniref:Uncharacterized protein n=1 Tax=Arcticibacterium luteifluviistationis TaxID=1784714 RepID=A0A2Z4GE16_9BACT|nr:hypothetical protein [Arcticibacterium luteifluviistationis]AWV99424.1 hypothetical protein DJ013_15145 [Arcticibacterium luteifluviistationis]